MSKVVSISNLSVNIRTIDGTLKVLREIDLEIDEGEVVGIVGETGCGKSVTAKTLLGILPIPPARILSGEVGFLGKDLLKLSKEDRQLMKYKIGYIPQDPMTSLNPVFTVGCILVDNLIWRMSNWSFFRYSYKRRSRNLKRLAEQQSIELLDKVNIPDPKAILRKYPMELSGGMRQRLLIAMSLIGNPTLLVADEPTTAIDVTIQKVILRLLAEKIQEENLSGLYITHDLGVARTICNRTYVMYAGTVVEMAETKKLLDNPLHPYTKGLVNSIPKLSGEGYSGIEGSVTDYFSPPVGCRFHPRCSKKNKECEIKQPNLHEIESGRFVACLLFE